jgi:hypothetical protein
MHPCHLQQTGISVGAAKAEQFIQGDSWLVGITAGASFPRSLWSKKLLSVWVQFSVVTELRVCFVVTVLLWTALCNLTMWLWTSRNKNSQHKLQLATCAVNNRAEACVVACGDIFKNLLKAYVCINWRNFMKLSYIYTLNLLGIVLAYCFVPFILNSPYLLFHVSSDHNSFNCPHLSSLIIKI